MRENQPSAVKALSNISNLNPKNLFVPFFFSVFVMRSAREKTPSNG